MIKRNQRLLNAINLISDGVLILLSYFAALWLRFNVLKGRQSLQITSPKAIATILVCSVLLVMTYYVQGLYGGGRLRRKREEGLYIIIINGFGTLAFMAVCYVVRLVDFSRLMLVLFWIISSFAVLLKHLTVRAVLSYYRRKGFNLKHVIIIGSGQLAYQYAQDIKNNPQLGYSAMGYIGDVCQNAIGKRLGTFSQIAEILEKWNPDEVVLALDPQDVFIIPDAMAAVDKEGVRLSLVPIFNDYIPNNPTIVSLGRTKMIDLRETLLDDLFWAMVKRSMDIVGSLVLILLFSPVMIAVAIGVKLSGPGPILFCQERVGKNKKPFKMLKFRSKYHRHSDFV